MFTFREFLYLKEGEGDFEIPDDIGPVVFGVGNMNPPTRGHLALAQRVVAEAKKINAPAYLFTTMSNKGAGMMKDGVAGKLYGGTSTKSAAKSARSPMSADDKFNTITELFYREIEKLDLKIVQATNYPMALGKLISSGYTDITLWAGTEYFTDPTDMKIVESMERFVYEKVNPYRKEQGAPMVKFQARQINRNTEATEGPESFKGSKARRAIHGHMAGETDEPTARDEFQKQTGWDRKDADSMFDRVSQSYRGSK